MENRTLIILYGSETGCAQDVSENLARQARRRHFKAKVFAMDDYDKVNILKNKDISLNKKIEFVNRRKISCLCLFNNRTRGGTDKYEGNSQFRKQER